LLTRVLIDSFYKLMTCQSLAMTLKLRLYPKNLNNCPLIEKRTFFLQIYVYTSVVFCLVHTLTLTVFMYIVVVLRLRPFQTFFRMQRSLCNAHVQCATQMSCCIYLLRFGNLYLESVFGKWALFGYVWRWDSTRGTYTRTYCIKS
jgi:hypothetical protein